MKQLFESIRDQLIIEELDNINANIINESLNCKLLKDVAKQIMTLKKNEKDADDKAKEEAKKTGGYYYSRTYNKSFKDIFVHYSDTVQWDKISDSDVIEFEDIDNIDVNDEKQIKKAQKKQEKAARDIIRGVKEGIIISYDKEINEYDYVIFNFGGIISLTDKPRKVNGYYTSYEKRHVGDRITHSKPRGNWRDLSITEKLDMIKDKKIYIIDLTGKRNEYNKLRQDRYNDKYGMILLDPESLKRMAESNIKRYKEIIAKNKAKRINNDALLDEAGELIEKISKYILEISKDPIDNADKIADASQLSLYLYDTRRYVSGRTPRQPGYYTGVNGLIPLLTKYTKGVKDTNSAGSDMSSYYEKEYKAAINEIEKTIKQIKDFLSKRKITL